MKIWLDDVRQMPAGFTHHCKTADEAIKLLHSGMVQHISFDHDLGTESTGYSVACYIESMAAKAEMPYMTWEIHSANPVGKANIKAAMESADRFWEKIINTN